MSRRRRTYSSSRKFKQQTLLDFLGSSPPSSPSNSFPKYPSPGPSKRKRTRITSSSSSSHCDSDKAQDTDSDVGAIRFEPEVVEISDEDHSPRRPKKRKSLVGTHAIPIRTISDESLEETIEVPRYQKGKNKVVLDSEDDIRPHKRKLVKGIRPLTPEEDDDILEAGNQVLESRLRSRGKMTAFQKNLEKLKMLKGKKRSEIVLGSSSEAEQSENSAGVPFKGAKPYHSGESDALHDETDSSDEDEKGFIVDDDALGAPAAQLPLAFSLSTRQDLTHHFKIVCQLFVHIAVRPLVDRRPFLESALKEEEYLSVPLQTTRRKLSGMRDSLVASSTWRSDFKKVLETYPKFTLVRLKFAIPQCDACHLGGRASTLLGRLSGKPYDEYDFEDVSNDGSDESSEEDEEDSGVDGKRDVRAEFHLGRFCAARTRIYHQFSHWEYSLYKSLQRKIMEAQDGTRRFVKVAYIGGIKPPRDLHDADTVMDWLDERGIIETEWQKVRQMMDNARNLERGETDDYV
ncbi:hypothetical protein J3R82DRAFT_5683 [Butyriboletus roseoflavus]|nr:hypothetical protein J3R82DRAFT_5683 [Butyriboletus roseoflavus]